MTHTGSSSYRLCTTTTKKVLKDRGDEITISLLTSHPRFNYKSEPLTKNGCNLVYHPAGFPSMNSTGPVVEMSEMTAAVLGMSRFSFLPCSLSCTAWQLATQHSLVCILVKILTKAHRRVQPVPEEYSQSMQTLCHLYKGLDHTQTLYWFPQGGLGRSPQLLRSNYT